jgi:DNA-binding transcriptional LysR family regulator
LQRCEHIIAQMSEAEREVKGANAPLAGSLRVHSMVGVGGHFLIPAIAHLRQLHPQVSFELTMGNRIPHFVEEGVDVAIVLADHLPDSGNVCQRLGETFNVLCASPGYIGTHGEPRAPTQVLEHQCLQLTGPTTALRQWRFECTDGVERITPNTGGFEVDASDTMISALEAGMGIGMLPIFAAQPAIDRGTLVRVLPSYRLQSLSVYAIYASRRYLDVRVKTLIDCLRSLVSAPMGDAAHDAPAAV